MRDIPAESVDLIIADPPYGINFEYCWYSGANSLSGRAHTVKRNIVNDKQPYIWFLPEAFRILKPNRPILIFTRYDVEETFRSAITCAGFICKSQIIWDKKGTGMGDLKGQPSPMHENIIFATKGRYTFAGHRPGSVITVNKTKNNEHPNQKPVPLMEYLIEHYSSAGDMIVDPFAGVGTVNIAAKNLNRNCAGIEIDASYCEIANRRISE